MKIVMKRQISGTRDGLDWPAPGEPMDVPDAEGADLCALGMAEPVAEPARAERAVAPKPSTRKAKG